MTVPRIMVTWNLETNRNMSAANKFEQLRQVAGGFKKSTVLDQFGADLKNRDTLRKSQMVALHILRALRKQGITQKQLADKLNVSAQQVNKWVKGKENFTLETIDKIEKALSIALIDVVEKGSINRVSASVNITTVYETIRGDGTPLFHASKRVERRSSYSRSLQYA